MSRRTLFLAALTLGVGPAAGGGWVATLEAQDANIHLPADRVEALLARGSFQIPDTMRELGHRSRLAVLRFQDGTQLPVKWAAAPRGGETFNNAPRYELAAYRLQALFLDGADYVVPPTAIRAVALDDYPETAGQARPTFDGVASVLVLLQYFLFDVTADQVFDRRRFDADSVYARHWADLNILTYLIAHNDSNTGNLLRSRDPSNPRVFAVDNGISFRSEPPTGEGRWRRLQVSRLPAPTVERLRALSAEDLERALGVLVEFEERGGVLVAVEPGENLEPGRGVRRTEGRVQLGLTHVEIADAWERLRELLFRVDRGRIDLF